MQESELLHGVVAWVVAWLLHCCCIAVAWKCSRFVQVYAFEVSYAYVSGTCLYIGRFSGRAKEGRLPKWNVWVNGMEYFCFVFRLAFHFGNYDHAHPTIKNDERIRSRVSPSQEVPVCAK